MPTFYYKAKKKNAETVMGQIIAQNRDEAVDLISQSGLMPVHLDNKPLQGQSRRRQRTKVKNKELFLFGRQLSSLLGAGVSLLRALEIIQAQISNDYFKTAIENIMCGMKEGRTFSDCINDFPDIFSSLYVAMVRAGEESGYLKDMIDSITVHQKKQNELTAKVRGALVYPAVLLVLGIATVVFILTFVMPKITVLFNNSYHSLPVPTKVLLALSNGLQKWWVLVAIGVGIIAVGIAQWVQSSKGKETISSIQLAVPYIRALMMKVQLARFSRTLELLIKSGIPILQAITIAIPVVNNTKIQNELSLCQAELAAGSSFGGTLQRSSVIPPMMGHLIAVGEESGSLAQALGDLADTYEEETNEVLQIGATIVEPLMIVVVGGVIGFIVIAILLPIFQMDVFA